MKKYLIKSGFLFIAFIAISVLSYTQTITFTINITDNCSKDSIYHGVAWVERSIGSPQYYCVTTQLSPDPIYNTNGSAQVSFDCEVDVETEVPIYKIHVYLRDDEDPDCDGQGVSINWMTSDELYGLNVPDINVTLN